MFDCSGAGLCLGENTILLCKTTNCFLEWTINDLHELAFGCVDDIGTTMSIGVYQANLSNRTLGTSTLLTSMLTFNASLVMNGTKIYCEDGVDGDRDTCTLFLTSTFESINN